MGREGGSGLKAPHPPPSPKKNMHIYKPKRVFLAVYIVFAFSTIYPCIVPCLKLNSVQRMLNNRAPSNLTILAAVICIVQSDTVADPVESGHFGRIRLLLEGRIRLIATHFTCMFK